MILTQRRRGAESVDELLCLCAKLLGCSIVSDDILRTPGFFLDWHLRCKSRLGFRERHPPCRHHPLDLLLPRGDDATYYIKIFLPVCFEEKWDNGDTNRTTETTGTIGTGASPVRPVCPVRPVKPFVDPLLHQRVNLRLEGAALLWVGKHLGRDAPALSRVGDKFVNDIVGVDGFDAELPQKVGKEGFATGNPSRQCDFHFSF